jgi:uncharacterized protein YjfI (DUF2170 family)
MNIYFTLDTMHTIKPFSSILYDSTVLASCKILPLKNVSICSKWQYSCYAVAGRLRTEQTVPE